MKMIQRILCYFNFHAWYHYPAIKEQERTLYIGTCTCCKVPVTFTVLEYTPPMKQKTRMFYNSFFVDDYDTGWR